MQLRTIAAFVWVPSIFVHMFFPSWQPKTSPRARLFGLWRGYIALNIAAMTRRCQSSSWSTSRTLPKMSEVNVLRRCESNLKELNGYLFSHLCKRTKRRTTEQHTWNMKGWIFMLRCFKNCFNYRIILASRRRRFGPPLLMIFWVEALKIVVKSKVSWKIQEHRSISWRKRVDCYLLYWNCGGAVGWCLKEQPKWHEN